MKYVTLSGLVLSYFMDLGVGLLFWEDHILWACAVCCWASWCIEQSQCDLKYVNFWVWALSRATFTELLYRELSGVSSCFASGSAASLSHQWLLFLKSWVSFSLFSSVRGEFTLIEDLFSSPDLFVLWKWPRCPGTLWLLTRVPTGHTLILILESELHTNEKGCLDAEMDWR